MHTSSPSIPVLLVRIANPALLVGVPSQVEAVILNQQQSRIGASALILTINYTFGNKIT
jgi:hypothetical protein